MFQTEQAEFINGIPVDVTIVMPCLDEAQSLPHCIRNAQDALDRIVHRYGLNGEIVIADNGSVDGSQVIATALGARVVPVPVRGFGAALIGGCQAALGRYILMGDCDGSYDFTDGVAMIGKLIEGHALCMGSRFDGGIAPGAMPWKNRYIGNPVLTGLLNLFFRAGINDAHCGLRAIRKESFHRLRLSGKGMEFASEMVIKAALLKFSIAQVPATLSLDLRDRAPHLRPWRDGWRHLRYLLMLAPNWLFGLSALVAALIAAVIFVLALLQATDLVTWPLIGDYWLILGGTLASIGHLSALLGLASGIHARKQGYRHQGWVSGMTLCAVAAISLGTIFVDWTDRGFAPASSILPAVAAVLAFSLGAQNFFGAFLLAIVGGNEAKFMAVDEDNLSAELDRAGMRRAA
jgi:glycosyltransferase involved in cell wall biosynthesis